MSGADAVVIGSGPNGLSAAVTLARAGISVEVIEGADTPGGGCRTEELTLPGFRHDVCSAVHPLAAASPFLSDLVGHGPQGRGLALRVPEVAFAHPLNGERAAAVRGSVEETAAGLGIDSSAYRSLMSPLVEKADSIVDFVLTTMRGVPSDPVANARFARLGLVSATRLAGRFTSDEAQALVAGVAAHSMRPLTAAMTGGFALLLAMLAHAVGWPVVEGGSSRIVDALVGELEALGGRVSTGRWIRSLDELPRVGLVLADVTPRQLVSLGGDRLGTFGRRAMSHFSYGPGVCKVDWALSGPVPWSADACLKAATLHLGGSLAEVAASEAEVSAGRHPQRPFCIVVQPGVVDPSRAPAGQHTLWAYCHVPSGSTADMTSRIEAQVERFAPGFADLVLARSTKTAADMEAYNPNYVGGDINGGAATLRQTLLRPVPRWNPYRTGIERVYLCSASTPPGGGVHGMCGVGAAKTALADIFKERDRWKARSRPL